MLMVPSAANAMAGLRFSRVLVEGAKDVSRRRLPGASRALRVWGTAALRFR
jgi:hypothetical protein